MTSSEEIQHQLAEYSRFVDETLKPQLAEVTAAANVVRAEVADYEDLGQRLDSLLLTSKQPGGDNDEKQQQQQEQQSPLESMVDLGYGAVFCKAVVPDASMIFVNVGMGFHVEMKIADARQFVSKRISFLKAGRLREKEAKETEIMGHIQSASIILNQLEAELQKARR